MTYTFKTRYIISLLFLLGYLITSLIIIQYFKISQIFSPVNDDLAISNFLEDSNFLPFKGERVIHLDLKGAPPSIDYLKSIFPLLHALGVTSLLIEYEDMFPYNDKSKQAINAFSKEDIKLLLQAAMKNNLSIIPLIQTFGHLEFILKMKSFSYLREEFKYPQSICPSHNDSFSILTGLLDEIIESHPNIRYIHIGCDEVYQIGLCQKCQEKMASYYWQTDDLFLDHVTRLAKYIRSKYPSITPLMWDDQLRSISIDKLKSFNIETLIEPVIWFYKPVVSLPSNMWQKYAKVFPSVWIASSFKGATGSDKIITDMNYHVKNQISWMYTMREYEKLINFKGVIITGWQRYDHFAILCELLPVSVPSLVHVALVLDGPRSPRESSDEKVKNVISCGVNNDLFGSCEFPGVNIYLAVVRFSQLKTVIDDVFLSSPVRGWLTAYNIKTKYSNKLLAEELSHKIEECQTSLRHTTAVLQETLRAVYDKYTVSEWIETNVQPYILKLNHTSSILRSLANISAWGPRYGNLISK